MPKMMDVDVRIEKDKKIIIALNSKITQENIVATVQEFKAKLLECNLDKSQIFDIYDVSIELLQNILKYSYGHKIDENKRREADGIFVIEYHSITKKFIITSCNLISDKQMEVIKQRLEEIENLNPKELRQLIRTKMRFKKDGHSDGAGLGFATIAKRVSEPLKVNFEKIIEGVFKYTLIVII